MKTFDELRENVEPDTELNEGKFLKRGSALLFSRNAQMHGNQAEQHFKIAKQKLTVSESTKPEDKQKLVLEGLSHICDGLISLRNQNGAITAIVTTSAVLGEKGHRKMNRSLRR